MTKMFKIAALVVVAIVSLGMVGNLYSQDFVPLEVNENMSLSIDISNQDGSLLLCATEQREFDQYGNCWPLKAVIDTIYSVDPKLLYRGQGI